MTALRTDEFDHSRFARIRLSLERFDPGTGWRLGLYEFLLFGIKQAWACLFGGLMLALLLATHFFYPEDAPVHRYDFLTIVAVAIQGAMLAFRLETWAEAKVILIFHVVGTVMELFKTAAGSWVYPEASILHIGSVPLFSGFMYAAVGSYIARVWRIFDFRYTGYPKRGWTWLLAAAVYVNFFAHHWLPDVRIVLFLATVLLFGRGWFYFTADRRRRSMPLLLGYGLVALFIWVAENLGTFARAWTYPDQGEVWRLVSLQKLGSWYLLMLVSIALVAIVRPPEREA